MGENLGFIGGILPGLIYKQAQEKKAASAAKNAQQDLEQKNNKAIQDVKDAQANASNQAAASIQAKQRARGGSQSVFTSPLGLSTADSASLAQKTLLGQ